MSWEKVLKNETQSLDKVSKLTKEIHDKLIGNFKKGIWWTSHEAHAQELHDVIGKLNEVAGIIKELNFRITNA